MQSRPEKKKTKEQTKYDIHAREICRSFLGYDRLPASPSGQNKTAQAC
jgi:hypothetical protein